MSGHVDAESLALYAEGEFSHRRTTRVRAHLAGCAECAATVAALSEVTAQLSHVPAAPMPAAVAARLDAALSAESAHRATAPATAPAGAPQRPPRRNPLWSPVALRILAATGATLVVAGGIGYAVSQSGPSGPSSGGAGMAAPASSKQHRAAIEGGPILSEPPTGGHHSLPNRGAPSARYVASGTDYQPGTLATQAKQKLTEPGLAPPSSTPAQVRDCVDRTAQGRPVLLVDQARYQQQPAIVIVLGRPETVIAVSDACTTLHSAPLTVRG